MRRLFKHSRGLQKPRVEAQGKLVGVFAGDSNEREVLVVLDFRIYYHKKHGERLEDLEIQLDFVGEDKEGLQRNGLEILKVGFFRPSKSAKAANVYEPIHSTDAVDGTFGFMNKAISPSRVSLTVKKNTFHGNDNSLCIATLVERRSSDEMVRMTIRTEVEVKTPLQTALRFASKKVDLLKGQPSTTALSWAAANGWEEYMNEVLGKEGLNLDREDNGGRTALSWAAGNGVDKAVALLLEHTADVNHPDKNGRSPLSWASENGQEVIVKVLLDIAETNLSKEDNDGRTPLSWAAGNGCNKVVDMLLEKGDKINPDQPDKKGRTPLWWSAENGSESCVLALLRFGGYSATGLVDNIEGVHRVNFDAKDHDGETPLSRAAQNENGGVIRILVEEGLQKYPESDAGTPKALSWAARYFHKAAERGWRDLTRVLIEKKVNIDSCREYAIEGSRTPLCTAAEQGHAQIVNVLLAAGANRDFPTSKTKDTPLLLAVREGREDVVKVLLEAGTDVSGENARGETPRTLALGRNHHTILTLLVQRDEDGPLAGMGEGLSLAPDHEFKATVVDFVYTSGSQKNYASEVPVDELLKNPRLEQDRSKGSTTSFRWLHLPANNMRWVEVLIAGLYENQIQAYRILSTDRWVGRQHHGTPDVHHDRFMRPLCQTFRGASGSSVLESTPRVDQTVAGKNMVLFMPYLHWDIEEQQAKRDAIINPEISGPVPQDQDQNRDQRLLSKYLRNQHPLHIRRTLDQYYYHAIRDTRKRDRDQVVSRYQRTNSLEPRVMTMVDQLWLWVLEGADGRVDTVVTCFPHRDSWKPSKDVGNQNLRDPDPEGSTDVLRHIKLSLLAEPLSVRTAYDLARLIAIKCSRAYLDIGSMEKALRFPEIYETAVGDVMRKEMELFENFTTLTKAPEEEVKYTSDIIKVLRADISSVTQQSIIDLCQRYRDSSFHEPLGSIDINSPDLTHDDGKEAKALDLLRKIGRIQILDITEEIKLLREVKDILDELNIMSMLFEDQKKVLSIMDSIIGSIPATHFSPQLFAQRRVQSKVEKSEENITTSELNMGSVDTGGGTSTRSQEELTLPVEMDLAPKAELVEVIDAGRYDHMNTLDSLQASASWADNSEKISKKQLMNWILETRGGPKNPSLSLFVVELSIDEIDRMSERARKANQALDFLVDLKQKQSNVLDARSARIQAEESLKMSKENERQGKTLIVFTVVTIIFLPLSFAAAFFAINITEFHRDAGGTLSLGYVSEIMFPVSAVTTSLLIYLAFKVERLENLWTWLKKLARGKHTLGDAENQLAGR